MYFVREWLGNNIWLAWSTVWPLQSFTKLTLYNTCIQTILLYGFECWAVTERDVLRIDDINQWCLWKLLGIQFYQSLCVAWWGEMDHQATTPFGCWPSMAFLPGWPHCVNARQNRFQENLNSFPPWRTGGDHRDALVLRGWRLSSNSWNPVTSPWM